MVTFTIADEPGAIPGMFKISRDAGELTPEEAALETTLSGTLGIFAAFAHSTAQYEKIVHKLREIATLGFIAPRNPKEAAAQLEGLRKDIDAALKLGGPMGKILESHPGTYFVVSKIERSNGRWDLLLPVRSGAKIPEDYSNLYVEITRTLTVLRVLYPHASERQSRLSSAILGWLKRQIGRHFEQTDEDKDRRDRSKFAQYFDKLFEIAVIGLGRDQPAMGTLALTGLQQEIVDREAGVVKNAYIRKLGFWAAAMALFATLVYCWARYGASNDTLYRFKEFFVIIAGCSVGAWLSFSMRRVALGFHNLAVIEEDRLDPAIRILFVTGLSIIVGLLFHTGVVLMTIGTFNTMFQGSGAKALLIGLLCGVGETGLSTAVGARASEFVTRIGGGTAAKK